MFEAMKLHGFWRSSAAYRVRIAFGLKRIAWLDVHVDLLAGQQKSDEYRAINPNGLVPALELTDGTIITQSLAILDWLEATTPEPPLFPEDPLERARVMAAGHVIAIDTHPIQNSGVVGHLKSAHGQSEEDGIRWMQHWIERGLLAFQDMIEPDAKFCFGDQPGFADVCLIPQLYNAKRWGVSMAPLSHLKRIEFNCMRLAAFSEARPEKQPDAEKR